MIEVKGQRFVITGAAGFIGSHLSEELVKQGKQVVAIDNLSAGRMTNLKPAMNGPGELKFFKLDVSEPLPATLFRGADVVFHEACSKCRVCQNNPHRDLEVNAYGSLNVFTMAAAVGAKVVHASTGSVNHGRPVSYYGVSKQAAEGYLRAMAEYDPGFRYTALRYHHVIGTRQDNSEVGGVVPIFIRQALRGEPITIFGDGKQVRHFTAVKDVVAANFACANDNNSDWQTYDLVSDVVVTINELAQIVKTFTGSSSPIVHLDAKAGDIRNFVFRNRFRGIEFNNSLIEMVSEIIEWSR